MHQVLNKPKSYWNNENLVMCFMDSLRNLLEGLRINSINDVFFPNVCCMQKFKKQNNFLCIQVNLLDRIKNKQVIHDNIGQLDRIIKRYDREGNVMDVFK